jgi:DNA methyltransferase 1-associated protein 1
MKQRSVEEIKERYYNVCNILNKLRHEAGTPEPKVVHYDAEHETKRKEQLRKLLSKTSEQVRNENNNNLCQ